MFRRPDNLIAIVHGLCKAFFFVMADHGQIVDAIHKTTDTPYRTTGAFRTGYLGPDV
jgi:hypothetical protein